MCHEQWECTLGLAGLTDHKTTGNMGMLKSEGCHQGFVSFLECLQIIDSKFNSLPFCDIGWIEWIVLDYPPKKKKLTLTISFSKSLATKPQFIKEI